MALNQLLNIVEYYNSLSAFEGETFQITYSNYLGKYYVQSSSSICSYGFAPLFNNEKDAEAVIDNPNFREILDTNEYITDFEKAQEIIGDSRFILAKESSCFSGVELNQRHIEALVALNQLFTIAEAWNKEDNFVPDFSDKNQDKWFPWFKYNEDAVEFVCAISSSTTSVCAYLGSRLCFKTSKRAAQFGKQFIDLYNKVFL